MMLNKKFSKLLCAVLAFAMIVTMLPAMALVASADEAAAPAGVNKLAFSDIANSPYQREIGVLNAISVLAGDPEGTFRPGDSISRAEMAAIIVRIYGMEANVIPSATKFDDVPADHWASGYVNIASGLGVINGDGDGKFRPDDKVKYNEAVKMLVCVLGYGMHAQEAGGWPAGYLVQATSLGVDEDVINTAGEASRETVAKLVYNTLDIEYLEKVGFGTDEQWIAYEGRTLLSEKMKVTKIEDIVSETYTTSLFGEGGLKEGQVRIGNTRFFIGESDVSKYIGYPVIAYAKYDAKVDKDMSTIVYYEIMEEDVVIIDIVPDDMAGATSNSITVFEDFENSTKTITYKKDTGTYIFENGVGNKEFDLSTLYSGGKAAFQGKLTIIDIDEDEIIDSIFIEDTETIVVSSIAKSSTGFYIRGKHTNERFPAKGNIKLADGEDKVSIYKDGELIDYTDLSEYDVLTYTNSGNVYNFTVCNETVEGAVQQITSDDEYVVDGKAYEKSPYFIDKVNKKLIDEPEIGDEVSLYLDIYGMVAYVEVTAAGSNADSYAYVVGMEKEDGFEGETQYSLILFTIDNEKISLPIAEKVLLKKNIYAFNVVDGAIKSTDLEVETLEGKIKDVTVGDLKEYGIFGSDNKPIRQMIKYAVADNKITEIETALEIIPFATTGTVTVNTLSGPVDVDATANKAAIEKINKSITATTPKKYKDELEVFTKTVMLDAQSSNVKKVAKRGDGYFALGGDSNYNASAYKWKGAQALFMPREGDVYVNNAMEFFSSDALFAGLSSYSTVLTADYEFYDVAKDGTSAVIVAKPDLVGTSTTPPSDLISNKRGDHMLITKVGTGTDEDGEQILRVVGQTTPYTSNKTSEATIVLDADTVINHRSGELALTDLAAGDVINYTALPNGKIYVVKSLFSVKKDTKPFSYAHGDTFSFGKIPAEINGLPQGVAMGHIVYSTEDDGATSIVITGETEAGASIEIGNNANSTGDFDPAGFTNYWVYDTNKKTMKKIEFADIPLPEELDESDIDVDNLPSNVFKVTDEEGNTYYAKCPRVLFHVHVSNGSWRKINFIYFDDGSFE